MPRNSAVPKRGGSKRGRTQKHAKERKFWRVQVSASAQTQVRKRAQKGAKEQKGAQKRKRAFLCKNCKQPGLKQPGLGTLKKQGTGPLTS